MSVRLPATPVGGGAVAAEAPGCLENGQSMEMSKDICGQRVKSSQAATPSTPVRYTPFPSLVRFPVEPTITFSRTSPASRRISVFGNTWAFRNTQSEAKNVRAVLLNIG